MDGMLVTSYCVKSQQDTAHRIWNALNSSHLMSVYGISIPLSHKYVKQQETYKSTEVPNFNRGPDA